MGSKCFPEGVTGTAHGMLKPPQFSKMLAGMALVVGFGDPKDSPTPLVGLSVGAAFLNPFKKTNPRDFQHSSLQKVGEPYVYKYDLNNVTSLLEAAEKAVAHPFGSFVPEEHQLGGFANAVCKHILADKPRNDCDKT